MNRTFVRLVHKMFLEHTEGVRFAEFKSEKLAELALREAQEKGKAQDS